MNRLIVGSPDKTKFILQFLAEDFSSGLVLIDPTGDLARAAANIVPMADTQRAFYFDPSDMAYPAGFNVLEGVPRDRHSKLTEDLCAYFEGMWPNGWGAQSNYILANCLRVLLATEGSTLLGVLKLMTDKRYRMTSPFSSGGNRTKRPSKPMGIDVSLMLNPSSPDRSAHAQHVRWVIAASASVTIAQAALDSAIAEYPCQRLTLRKGAMLIREHTPQKQD